MRYFSAMTHYYLYIEAGQVLDETARFYQVGIGTSRQANSDYLYLLSRATESGHYFALWSDEVDDFLSKVKKSLHRSDLTPQRILARDYVRACKAAVAVPPSVTAAVNADHMRKNFDTTYRIISNLRRCKKPSA